MEQERDILENQNLRKMPFTVPEGYFAEMPERMKESVLRQEVKAPFMKRVTPYIALAASFLILVAGGTFFLRNTTPETPETATYYALNSTSSDEMTEEDIIAYLIWSGTSLEEYADYIGE